MAGIHPLQGLHHIYASQRSFAAPSSDRVVNPVAPKRISFASAGIIEHPVVEALRKSPVFEGVDIKLGGHLTDAPKLGIIKKYWLNDNGDFQFSRDAQTEAVITRSEEGVLVCCPSNERSEITYPLSPVLVDSSIAKFEGEGVFIVSKSSQGKPILIPVPNSVPHMESGKITTWKVNDNKDYGLLVWRNGNAKFLPIGDSPIASSENPTTKQTKSILDDRVTASNMGDFIEITVPQAQETHLITRPTKAVKSDPLSVFIGDGLPLESLFRSPCVIRTTGTDFVLPNSKVIDTVAYVKLSTGETVRITGSPDETELIRGKVVKFPFVRKLFDRMSLRQPYIQHIAQQ